MAGRRSAPAARVIELAAYVKARSGSQVTLGDITRDVPGYDDGAAPRDDHGELTPDTTQWETLRKKVQRDLKDLADHWGVHVEWIEGAKSYSLRPAFFSTAERAALIAAAAVVEVEDDRAGLPGELGAAVDDEYTAIVVQVPEIVAALRDACATRTAVRFRHGGIERTLEPYALGQWANHWYVAGWSPDTETMRRYRLDRIEQHAGEDAIAPAGSAGSYEVPDWFDVALAFDMDPNSWGHDPALNGRIRVDIDQVPAFVRELGGEVIALTPDHAVVTLTIRHYQWTRDRLLGFRGYAVPLEPPELIALIHNHLVDIAGHA